MKFFITETEAIALDSIMAVDLNGGPDPKPCIVTLRGNVEWELTRVEGIRLLEALRHVP